MNLGKAIASELVPTVGRLIGRVERLLFQALLAETSLQRRQDARWYGTVIVFLQPPKYCLLSKKNSQFRSESLYRGVLYDFCHRQNAFLFVDP
jgi:hypothetical protein